MRLAILAVAASLALTGCGKKAATGNTNTLDESVTAEDFATNDATAIDAATGADANMAADVDINLIENEGDQEPATARASVPERRPRETAPANDSSASVEPAAPAEPAPQPAEANAD